MLGKVAQGSPVGQKVVVGRPIQNACCGLWVLVWLFWMSFEGMGLFQEYCF